MWLPGSCRKHSSAMPHPAVSTGPSGYVRHNHDWLWGLHFKTLCNHVFHFLSHPSLKVGEISLAVNTRPFFLLWFCLAIVKGAINTEWKSAPSLVMPGADRKWVEGANEATLSVLSIRIHRDILADCCVPWILAPQIMAQRPAATASPGSLLGMKNLSPT